LTLYLLDLPSELLEVIFGFLDAVSLLNLSLVSCSISLIAQSDKLWLLLVRERWPHVDWALRAEYLLRQIVTIRTNNIIQAPVSKILYAQQVCLSSKARGNTTENDLRLLRARGRELHKHPHEYQHIKMVLIGDPGVGRTSLSLAAIHNVWTENLSSASARSYLPDLDQFGGRVWSTTLHLEHQHLNGQVYSFHTEIYEPSQNNASIAIALRNCDVAILVFDVTNRPSFDNITTTWAPLLKSIPTILAGLKPDLIKSVHTFEAQTLADSNNFLKYIEFSAKEDRSIDIFQDALLAALSTQHQPNESCTIM